MTEPGISDDDELTVESLRRDLSGTSLGDAIEKREQEEQAEENQREALVRKKVLLATAEDRLDGDDDAVAALRADVHDLQNDLEAEALISSGDESDDLGEEEQAAREKISELEALANTSNGPAAASFSEKAEALKKEHGIDADAPNKYSAEALAAGGADVDLPDDPDAEALAAHQSRKEQADLDERMSDGDQKLLSNYKTLRNQTSSEKVREKYAKKIEDLRNQYA